MKQRKVTKQTAKLAKQKGFNEWCDMSWSEGKVLPTNDFTDNHLFAPTQSFLQKWLRDNHFLNVNSYPNWIGINAIENYAGWECDIEKLYPPYESIDVDGNFNSYEEALEIGLQEALKLID